MRPGWKPLAVAGTVIAAVVTGGLLLTRGDGGRAPLLWHLFSVSADARTVGVLHDDPHCDTKSGRARVRESSDSVKITISQVATRRTHACTLDYRAQLTRVRLARPLGTRRLVQPAGGVGDRSALREFSQLRNRDCARFVSVAADAPAQQVAWFARRVRLCREPIAAGMLRFAFLRRARSSADALAHFVRATVGIQSFVARVQWARGARRPARMWLIPGPRLSCLYAEFADPRDRTHACRLTSSVVEHGLIAARRCGGLPSRGPVSLVGVVPAGVQRVDILRAGRVIATAPVRRGAWSARVRNPDHVAYRGVRTRVGDAEPSPC